MEVLYRLKTNDPLLLDNPEKVWVVQTGSVTLFATKIKDGSPILDRRYMFSVGYGSALFGAALVPDSIPAEQRGLLAVACEEIELSLISIADLVGQVAEGSAVRIAQVEGWINHYSQTFSKESTTPDFSRYKSLIKPENAAQLPNILTDLHTNFFGYLNLLSQQETEAAFRQFQEIEQLNRQVVNSVCDWGSTPEIESSIFSPVFLR